MTNTQQREEKKKTKKASNALCKAVQKYVEANGGSVVVIGGIALVRESPLKYNYGIMVRCTGEPPQVPKKQP